MEENKSVTSFKVAGEYFAFETENIRNILEDEAPTRVPLTKSFLKGVINNHGNIIPVVDFRALLGKEPDETLKERCIVVLGVMENGREELIGFRVDEMDDVFEYTHETFKNEVVLDVNNPAVQSALQGTIKSGDKFIYLTKIEELQKALV